MKTSVRIAGAVFIALSFTEVLFLALGNETVHTFVKPFLIPSLAVAALLALLPSHSGKRTWMMAVGLLLHTAGDILLLIDNLGFIYFALGMGAFLIGHFFYLWVLMNGMGGLKGWKEYACLYVPMLLAYPLTSLFGAQWPMSGVLVVYALTLMYYVSAGVLWALRGRRFAWRVIAGGLLFIISDALIGINAFADIDFALRHAFVLGTYLPAEWLLVSAMVRTQLQES